MELGMRCGNISLKMSNCDATLGTNYVPGGP